MKKVKLICAFLATVLALAVFAACADKPQDDPATPITPVDFADSAVTVSYGDDYSFSSALNVKGSDGETYRASVKVTNDDGRRGCGCRGR